MVIMRNILSSRMWYFLRACVAIVALHLLSVNNGAFAQGSNDARRPKNLALGAAYECVVRPNYWGWKNPEHGDLGQLADGIIVETWHTDQGDIYTLPSSMGWNGVDPVVIFDLGEVQTIGGIGLHTMNSYWGPWWPDHVAVLVSDDNENFYLAGPVQQITPERLTPPLSRVALQAGIDRQLTERGFKPTTHWFRTRALRARGRYVALIMALPASGSIVLTEVEIYASAESRSQTSQPQPVFSEGQAGWKSYKLHRALSRRISADVDALKQKILHSALPVAERQQMTAELAHLHSRIGEQAIPLTSNFRAILPFNDLHRSIFALQAGIWRAQGLNPLHTWQSHRWDPLTPFEEPPIGQDAHLQIVMAGNEVRSDVINLSNSTTQPMTVRLQLIDLPVESLDLFEVPLVDTHEFQPVAAALLPLAESDGFYQVTIESGMTRQIWIRCSSRRLNAGEYQGIVRISAVDEANIAIDVPASIEIVDVQLPDRLSLHLGGWDYPSAGNYQVSKENAAQYVSTLLEYGVNVTWAWDVLPMGTYDNEGGVITAPSRAAVDAWLANFPDAQMYCVVAICLYGQPEATITAWARDWSQYLVSCGVAPEKFALMIRDEPTTAEELNIILTIGRAVKRGEPRFKIFNDIHFGDPTKAPPVIEQVMREACDIQCFEVGHYLAAPDANQAFMEQQSRAGLQWWCYSAGGSHRLADPYVAWCLRGWFCFSNGLEGAHWWAFGDGTGGWSWNEYLNSGATRSPLYLAQDTVIVGKAMEAMREGAQDYELLQMLKHKAGDQGASATAAQRLLDHDLPQVMQAYRQDQWMWHTPKDRSEADHMRIKILRVLDAPQ